MDQDDLQPFNKMASAFGTVCTALNVKADKEDVYRIFHMALEESAQLQEAVSTDQLTPIQLNKALACSSS